MKDYSGNLNKKDMGDNKRFWETVKPLFSCKANSSGNIMWLNEDKIINHGDKSARLLNSFFSNVIKNLEVPGFKDFDFTSEFISNPSLKAIKKLCNPQSVFAIRNLFNPQAFGFSTVSVDDVLKEINKSSNGKVIQSIQIPVKLLKIKCCYFRKLYLSLLNV